MRTEAGRHKAPEGSFVGGMCIDEMSIQDDLRFVNSNGEIRLGGLLIWVLFRWPGTTSGYSRSPVPIYRPKRIPFSFCMFSGEPSQSRKS
ncbi:hypothetical protein MAR_009641 [Mya arenaria]|uniref:Uncharacterized protein n=1 Tax=Mya arenaria TaxID=6604 RepID=A0ABY7E2R9_MYAAR|nr:hypothetical protein MAR_009641 [Mya arenaria]